MWRKCSSCKKEIGFKTKYWVCNVSTCNRKRTGLVFCSVACWDAHVPMMNHRESWALEETSPSAEAREREAHPSTSPSSAPAAGRVGSEAAAAPVDEDEILIVASKLKAYIRDRSGGFSTSANVMDKLSGWVRAQCDRAIRKAEEAGRKTVMDRDIL